MPLQPYAQRRIEEKLKELYDAYHWGYNTGVLGERALTSEAVEIDEFDFKFFLESKYPILEAYWTPEMFEKVK